MSPSSLCWGQEPVCPPKILTLGACERDFFGDTTFAGDQAKTRGAGPALIRQHRVLVERGRSDGARPREAHDAFFFNVLGRSRPGRHLDLGFLQKTTNRPSFEPPSPCGLTAAKQTNADGQARVPGPAESSRS